MEDDSKAYSPGSLVKARGREWLVLPESTEELLKLRPLGGVDVETAGILTALEEVSPARFDLPTPDDIGDFRSCQLLRDAIRLGFRNGAGPFRCFGRIAVDPRPYQLVPLLMALRLDPIRLLIADDIGVGKTIEACLIAREMLDRGEIARTAVLCPAQLAEQWQKELQSKFHIDSRLVLPGTARRLERHIGMGKSLFDVYPHVVVSLDYIKSDRHRSEFLRACPDFVIVDEAHTCARSGRGRGVHQRHRLVRDLADDPERHMLFLTATPHSGKEEAFRELLGFLDRDFLDLPEELTGQRMQRARREVARHFIQRGRGDVKSYLDETTTFPTRLERETSYNLHNDYRRLMERVISYARETVLDETHTGVRRRVRWWSALALLRSLASSPAAAEATLKARSNTVGAETEREADELGRKTVTDIDAESSDEIVDIVPGSDWTEISEHEESERRRLRRMASRAANLRGKKDLKLQKAIGETKQLLKEGHNPILFCRFIPTADYVAEEMAEALGSRARVESITSVLPPAERESRVRLLGEAPNRVLVCTDCLSEGINLQQHFDSVIHYDLSWNPTRHEQRAGRVDRFGQNAPEIKILTYYGRDNRIDGIVLDVIIRKHRRIKENWGISVPVPAQTGRVMEAVMEGLLLRSDTSADQMLLSGLEEWMMSSQTTTDLDREWEEASQREKRSRSLFAQARIGVEEVKQELQASRSAVGSPAEVREFFNSALAHNGASISENGTFQYNIDEVPAALSDMIPTDETKFAGQFELPVPEGVHHLSRTSPIVEAVASYVADTAMDPIITESVASRCGVTRTTHVSTRTTLLLVRLRFEITTIRDQSETGQIAEECRLLAFQGSPANSRWLPRETAEQLYGARPEANVGADIARHNVGQILQDYNHLRPHLEQTAEERAQALLESHRRVRSAAGLKGVRYTVEHKEPDLIGLYIFLPVPEVM